MEGEIAYDGGELEVTSSLKEAFDKNGFIVVRGLLNEAELRKLKDALESDDGILSHAYELLDAAGGKSKLCLWNQPGQDVTGMLARSRKVAGTMSELLRGEVYHYHTKLMMKGARTGGAHEWHQDYGYWYKNDILRPDMGTVFIAVDASKRENGCIQVLQGSHRCGRIEHAFVGGQTGADMSRVSIIRRTLVRTDLQSTIAKSDNTLAPVILAPENGQEQSQVAPNAYSFAYPHRFVEMQPGDAIFFHSLLLHRSDANHSESRRWAFLIAYNRADNDSLRSHHHAAYTPLAIVENRAILDCPNNAPLHDKQFLDPRNDKSVSYSDR